MASYFGEACHRLGYEGHYFSMLDGKVDDSKVDFFHEINIFIPMMIKITCHLTVCLKMRSFKRIEISYCFSLPSSFHPPSI